MNTENTSQEQISDVVEKSEAVNSAVSQLVDERMQTKNLQDQNKELLAEITKLKAEKESAISFNALQEKARDEIMARGNVNTTNAGSFKNPATNKDKFAAVIKYMCGQGNIQDLNYMGINAQLGTSMEFKSHGQNLGPVISIPESQLWNMVDMPRYITPIIEDSSVTQHNNKRSFKIIRQKPQSANIMSKDSTNDVGVNSNLAQYETHERQMQTFYGCSLFEQELFDTSDFDASALMRLTRDQIASSFQYQIEKVLLGSGSVQGDKIYGILDSRHDTYDVSTIGNFEFDTLRQHWNSLKYVKAGVNTIHGIKNIDCFIKAINQVTRLYSMRGIWLNTANIVIYMGTGLRDILETSKIYNTSESNEYTTYIANNKLKGLYNIRTINTLENVTAAGELFAFVGVLRDAYAIAEYTSSYGESMIDMRMETISRLGQTPLYQLSMQKSIAADIINFNSIVAIKLA